MINFLDQSKITSLFEKDKTKFKYTSMIWWNKGTHCIPCLNILECKHSSFPCDATSKAQIPEHFHLTGFGSTKVKWRVKSGT